MVIDVPTFKVFLSAFKNTNDAYIALHLAEAQKVCLADIYGDQTAAAVFYWAANRMALDPAGFGAKLDTTKQPEMTTYEKHWRAIALGCGIGFRVT